MTKFMVASCCAQSRPPSRERNAHRPLLERVGSARAHHKWFAPSQCRNAARKHLPSMALLSNETNRTLHPIGRQPRHAPRAASPEPEREAFSGNSRGKSLTTTFAVGANRIHGARGDEEVATGRPPGALAPRGGGARGLDVCGDGGIPFGPSSPPAPPASQSTTPAARRGQRARQSLQRSYAFVQAQPNEGVLRRERRIGARYRMEVRGDAAHLVVPRNSPVNIFVGAQRHWRRLRFRRFQHSATIDVHFNIYAHAQVHRPRAAHALN